MRKRLYRGRHLIECRNLPSLEAGSGCLRYWLHFLSVSPSSLSEVQILISLQLSLFIAALDQTLLATSIPTISSELHSASGYTWIGAAYLLANAAAGPIWAKLSDIWGRKPILLTAVAMFFASSIVCALSVNMAMLIVGRALQGSAGGGLIQLVNITISDLFSMRSETHWTYPSGFWVAADIAQESEPLSWSPGVHVGFGRWCWSYPRRCLFTVCVVALEFLDQPTHIRDDICASCGVS